MVISHITTISIKNFKKRIRLHPGTCLKFQILPEFFVDIRTQGRNKSIVFIIKSFFFSFVYNIGFVRLRQLLIVFVQAFNEIKASIHCDLTGNLIIFHLKCDLFYCSREVIP